MSTLRRCQNGSTEEGLSRAQHVPRAAVFLLQNTFQHTRGGSQTYRIRGDGNQREYVADFVPVEKKFYSYRDAITILDEWFKTHSDDQALRDKLTISGLSSALKAEKRAQLANKLGAVADVQVETELRVWKARENGNRDRV